MYWISKHCLNNISSKVLFASLLLVAWSAEAQDKTFDLRLHQASVPQYERITVSIPVSKSPTNPFDPTEVRLDAVVKLPSGKQLTVPGFWYQEYRRHLQNPEARAQNGLNSWRKWATRNGGPLFEWRGGFAPHRCELGQASGTERSREQTFTVTASAKPGFVRRSNRNPTYLELESGEPFFPIGLNLCMYQKRKEPTTTIACWPNWWRAGEIMRGLAGVLRAARPEGGGWPGRKLTDFRLNLSTGLAVMISSRPGA
jgi:hypothetical protein